MLPGCLAMGFYRVVIQLWVGFCVDMLACRTPKKACYLTLKVGTSWPPHPPWTLVVCVCGFCLFCFCLLAGSGAWLRGRGLRLENGARRGFRMGGWGGVV